ncbi:MAG: hypothetical protein C4332_14390 [Meiothermus sp.]
MTETERLLSELVRINSVNPDLVPGAPGEGEIARFVGAWLKERGFETHWLEAKKGRPTVVGVAKGTAGRSLMFNGHTDTVTLEGVKDGLNPVIRDGQMYRRGVYDMKSGAAARAKALNLRGDLLVVYVADEEYGSLGSEELTLAHRGFVWLERRSVPGETPEAAEAEIQAVLDRIAASDPEFKATVRQDLARGPHAISETEPIVQILRAQASHVLGAVPKVRGDPWWMDCGVLSGAGIPSFLFGVKGTGAHSAEEWVDLESVEDLSEILYQTAKEFCS